MSEKTSLIARQIGVLGLWTWLAAVVMADSVPQLPGKASEVAAPHIPVVAAAAPTTIKLPAPLSSVARGGAGRYLLLHLPKLAVIGVFDLAEGRIVKHIPVASTTPIFSAGMDKAIIYLPEKKLLECWDLKTFQKDQSVPLVDQGEVREIAVGAAAQRYFMMLTDKGPSFWSLSTLTPKELIWNVQGAPPGPEKVWVKASDDGMTYAQWYGGGGTLHYAIDGNRMTITRYNSANREPYPISDNAVLLTGVGPLDKKHDLPNNNPFQNMTCFPAADSAFFVAASWKEEKKRSFLALSLHLTEDSQQLLHLPDLPEIPYYVVDYSARTMVISARVHLVPSIKKLVTIPSSNEELVIRSIDLFEEIKKVPGDYLCVVSRPPQLAKRGTLFTYPIEVLRKSGAVKYRLEQAPLQMRLSSEGKLTWDIPLDTIEGDEPVSIIITNASGHEIQHRFLLTVW